MADSTSDTASSTPPSLDVYLPGSSDGDALLHGSTDSAHSVTSLPSCSSQTPTEKNADRVSGADADLILDFIALLDTADTPNETGWTHATALRALATKRHRAGFECENRGISNFDFFSHFDPELRGHLRLTFDRRKQDGYTGDAPVAHTDATLSIQSMLQATIAPTKKSQSPLAMMKAEVDAEWENVVLDDLDGMFTPTVLVCEDEEGS